MVAIPSKDADKTLTRLPQGVYIVLLHGGDSGLVSERSRKVVASLGVDRGDPFQMVTIEGPEVAETPGRLLDEANTIGLFQSMRAILVYAQSADITPALQNLMHSKIENVKIVIEAPGQKLDSPLRKFCEREKFAISVECEGDTEGDVDTLLDAKIAETCIAVTAEARSLILRVIGADRMSTRMELNKLFLYADGKPEIGVSDVESIVSDASALDAENLIYHAFCGQMGEMERVWQRVGIDGLDGSTLLSAAFRSAHALHGLLAHSDAERAQYRYRQARGYRPLNRDALGRWTLTKVSQVLPILATASARNRKDPILKAEIAARALLSIAFLAQRPGQRPS